MPERDGPAAYELHSTLDGVEVRRVEVIGTFADRAEAREWMIATTPARQARDRADQRAHERRGGGGMIAVAQPPLPAPMPAIVRRVCPWQGQPNFGCFFSHGVDGVSAAVVFVGPENSGLWTKEHELGHAYIAQRLSAGEGRRLERVSGMGAWDEEAAADLYAGCRLKEGPLVWGQIVYELDAKPDPTPGWRARVCGVISRAFWR